MRISKFTPHPDDMSRWRRYTTDNVQRVEGIPFHDELAGAAGADFYLLVSADEHAAKLQQAGRALCRNRDVVDLFWVDLRE